jgi:hypothetical protein
LGAARSGPLSFPAGKGDFLTLHPLNFYEGLFADGAEGLCQYVRELSAGREVSIKNSSGNQALSLYAVETAALIGGKNAG